MQTQQNIAHITLNVCQHYTLGMKNNTHWLWYIKWDGLYLTIILSNLERF